MKFKFAALRFRLLMLALFVPALGALPVFAQEEGVATVLDEPVVQVNNSVIMLSTLKRENNEFKNVLIKQRGLSEQDASVQVTQKQPEIIGNLINEALLMEKGKDIAGLSEDVEAEVNREVLRVANQAGSKSMEELEAAMRAEGISLSEIRETLRTQFMRQAVLQREVDYKIYFGLSNDELKKYYDTHRDRFQRLTISEIFLSLAGRTEAEVLAKAKQIVAQARGGADFGALAATHSEREQNGARVAAKTQGRVEEDGKLKWFLASELNADIANAVKNVKAGGVTEPLKVDEGYLILRVNERDDAFNENQVRGALVQERGEKERETYMRTLRREAYIKPADNYKDLIQPLLDKDTAATTASKGTTRAKDTKEEKKQ